jgi:ferritin heavy chain
MRGGSVVLSALQAPPAEYKSARNAAEFALDLEKDITKSLISLHAIAEEENDQSLQDFLEEQYLRPQSETIKKFADLVTNLNRVGNEGLGLFLLNQELLKENF